MYSVKAASQHTGLPPETLRAWERRYQAVTPERDDAGRRIYSQADMLRLLLLRQATELGHPIRRLAQLDEPALKHLLCDQPDSNALSSPHNAFYEGLLEAAMNFDQRLCTQEITRAQSLYEPDVLVRKILGPALREIGRRWAVNQASIAQERVLSSAVEHALLSVMNIYRHTARGPTIIWGTLSGERHPLGALMACYLAAARGFACRYLGGDLPACEFADVAHSAGAAVAGVGTMTGWLDGQFGAQLKELCEQLPEQCELWVGGTIKDEGDQPLSKHDSALVKCIRLHDLDDLTNRLDLLRA